MLDEARQEFERLLELNSADVEARFHLALISLREEKYRDALRQLKLLLGDTGPRFGAFVNMAFALRALGRPQDALLVLDEAEGVRAGTSAVALARAVALIEAGDKTEAAGALQQYMQRLRGGERPAPPYYYYSALLAALGKRLNEADALVMEGLQEHPESAPLLLLAGLIAERKGEYQTAEKQFRQVMEEDAGLVVAYKNLGDVYYRRGALDESMQQYRRALEMHPDLGDDTLAKLGNIFYRRGEREEALRHWNRALTLNPDNEVVRNNIEIAQDAG
jgi:tetratricopeptide (TPR) repeat protein